MTALLDSPAKFLRQKPHGATSTGRQLAVLAIVPDGQRDWVLHLNWMLRVGNWKRDRA